MRKELLPYARNQTQIVDASHLILLCRRTDVDTDFVNHYFETIASTRQMELSALEKANANGWVKDAPIGNSMSFNLTPKSLMKFLDLQSIILLLVSSYQ